MTAFPGSDINIRGVELVFGGRTPTTALSELSLDIAAGEFVSLVGPSGCGKSSLLRIILGLTKPTSGRIEIGGKPVAGPRRDVGIVFQQPVLLNWRSVLSNVLLPIDIARGSRAQAMDRARELLDKVGLAHFERHYPLQLSGGMRQRVAIVRGLMHDPAVLLMDEPFAALDAMTRERMSADLQTLWMDQRKTVVFVTHGIIEAIFLSTKIVVMSARPGRVLSVLDVDLPFPRDLDMMGTATFAKLAATIRHQLEEAEG